ncbi:MAG: TRAP transporter small permease [Spirochaetales bacterium]|nr:TRAP transporter small permease [Spirochaetales bacterium]
MRIYKKIMDHLARILFIVTAAMICAMVLIITWQVFSRFVLNKTPRWSEESTIVLMLYSGFLGAALAYRERLHIGIKFFLLKIKQKTRSRIYFFIDILIGLFSLFMLIWGTGFAWMMRSQTLPATKIPVGISYLPIPLAGLMLILFVIEKIGDDFAEHKTGTKDLPLNITGMEV